MKAYRIDTGLSGLSDLIHSEYDPTYTTGKGVLLAGSGAARVLTAFCLVATVYSGNATVQVGANVGTGNGAIGVVTADPGAMTGLYQVTIIEPGANAGSFQVFRPDGVLDGNGVVGAAYNGMINFTLADGATDFVSGDRIPVTVSYPNNAKKFVQWDPAATNGAQTITGINLFETEAADGVDGELVYLKQGPVIVRKPAIAFHVGATDAQKAAAFAALAALGIDVRETG